MLKELIEVDGKIEVLDTERLKGNGAALGKADVSLLQRSRKIDIRLQELGKGWKISPWQAAVTLSSWRAELLEGRDAIVSAQTGSGKSMCYIGLPIVSPFSLV